MMVNQTNIYIEAEDTIDWEPDQRFTVIWFGTEHYKRHIKLALNRKKARELRNLLTKLIGRSDRKRP